MCPYARMVQLILGSPPGNGQCTPIALLGPAARGDDLVPSGQRLACDVRTQASPGAGDDDDLGHEHVPFSGGPRAAAMTNVFITLCGFSGPPTAARLVDRRGRGSRPSCQGASDRPVMPGQ